MCDQYLKTKKLLIRRCRIPHTAVTLKPHSLTTIALFNTAYTNPPPTNLAYRKPAEPGGASFKLYMLAAVLIFSVEQIYF